MMLVVDKVKPVKTVQILHCRYGTWRLTWGMPLEGGPGQRTDDVQQ